MKYVLVTGAASGLGKHLTLKYAELGYTVYALDIDKNNLANLPKENIIPLCMNIASEESWDRDVLPRLEADNKGLEIVIALSLIHSCRSFGRFSGIGPKCLVLRNRSQLERKH